MIFDFLFSVISTAMLCFCISSILIPEKKYSYTIPCTPLTLIEMFIFTYPSLLNNFLLIILICVTHACMLYIHKYKAVIYSISTTLLFFTALLFVNLLYCFTFCESFICSFIFYIEYRRFLWTSFRNSILHDCLGVIKDIKIQRSI